VTATDTDVPTLAAFEEEARAFLVRTSPPRRDRAAGWGEGSDEISAVAEKDREEELADVAVARAWRRELFDAGLGWLTGPTALGGRGLPVEYQEAFDRVAEGFELPPQQCFTVGLHIVAPTIVAHGTDEARALYLEALYRADLMACQLFSEPDAGSDLAGVKARAVREEGGWRVSGQKVWTSGAHYSDLGEMLVRTDPSASKHGGLSMVLVDMADPGVEVRPLRQMSGGAAFNEVFVEDVFVPDSHVLAEPGQGWRVAMTTLGSERSSMGSGGANGGEFDPVPRLVDAARHLLAGPDGEIDPLTRDELARATVSSRVLALLTERFAAGGPAVSHLGGAEMSLAKLAMTRHLMAVSDASGRVLGPRLVADTGEWGTYAWAQYVLGVPSYRLAGGTDEIMLNIIGERALGLPREPR
jgi:alkylation response protein AidB-like acyl-CoA dehydrogenase